MKEIVEKKEVEELLGCEITDEQFEEALKYGCGAEINERVYEYSLNKFGRPLCMKCQKGAGK